MAKKNKKRKKAVDKVDASEVIKLEARRRNRKYILPLIINTIVFLTVYWVLVSLPIYNVVLWIYLALTLGFTCAYIIYNRGFYRKGVTPDMLPDSMSLEEKQKFIAEGEERIERSKWMLTVIIPLMLTFCLDLFWLYVAEPILTNLGM